MSRECRAGQRFVCRDADRGFAGRQGEEETVDVGWRKGQGFGREARERGEEARLGGLGWWSEDVEDVRERCDEGGPAVRACIVNNG